MQRRRRRQRATGVAGVLAAVHIAPEDRDWAKHPYCLRYLNGMHAESDRRGFCLDSFWGDGSPSGYKALFRKLKARGVEGIAFFLTMPHALSEIPFPAEAFAGVYLGAGFPSPRLHQVDIDHRENLLLAWRQARIRGHKRIGLAVDREFVRRLRGARLDSFLYCQREVPQSDRVDVLEFDRPGNVDRIVEWTKRERLDALLFGGDDLVLEIRRRRPAFKVYCLDISTPGQGLCGIDAKPEVIGKIAVDILYNQIMRGEVGEPPHPQRFLVEGAWVDPENQPVAAPSSR